MPPTLSEFVAVYGLLYAAFGVQSPFLPALLRERGCTQKRSGSFSALRRRSVSLPVPRLVTALIVCIDTHRSYADVPSWRP